MRDVRQEVNVTAARLWVYRILQLAQRLEPDTAFRNRAESKQVTTMLYCTHFLSSSAEVQRKKPAELKTTNLFRKLRSSVSCMHIHGCKRLCRHKEHLLPNYQGCYANVNCSTAVTSRLNLLRCVYIEQGATTLYRATLGASLLSQSLKVLQKQVIS